LNANVSTEVATLAGGCFWCLEAVFSEVEGILSVIPGYAGGSTDDPTYEQVCSGHTGHAESVQITFSPAVISYRDLLEIFFTVHDPTTLNRQGADAGTQYRSAIFFHDAGQQAAAAEVIAKLEKAGTWKKIVTQVAPLDKFYPAEAYHRDYYKKHPEQGYCRMVISPKVAKLRQKWAGRLKAGN
jgi:peptide-methionine (S)-S-oxide reductase